jgi:hypothetical protein
VAAGSQGHAAMMTRTAPLWPSAHRSSSNRARAASAELLLGDKSLYISKYSTLTGEKLSLLFHIKPGGFACSFARVTTSEVTPTLSFTYMEVKVFRQVSAAKSRCGRPQLTSASLSVFLFLKHPCCSAARAPPKSSTTLWNRARSA